MKIFYLSAIVVLLFAGCNSGLTGTSLQGEPKEIVVNALKKIDQQKSFVLVMVAGNDAVQGGTKITLKYVAPDSFHTVTEFAGQKMENITIGDDTYDRLDGKWTKSKDQMGGIGSIVQKFYNKENESLIVDVKRVGVEKIDDVESEIFEYRYDVRALSGKLNLPADKSEVKIKIWINADGLPVKQISTQKAEGLNNKTETLTKTTLFKFNEEVKIEAPQT